MKDVSKHLGPLAATNAPSLPATVDRETWQEQIAALRVREKAHTREADAIAAARRRLPMVEVDAATPVIGAHGQVPLIDVFEGRSQPFASYMMWYDGASAAHQCEGCTLNIGHVLELGYLHSRDVTFSVLCQGHSTRLTGTGSSWNGRCPGIRCPQPRSVKVPRGCQSVFALVATVVLQVTAPKPPWRTAVPVPTTGSAWVSA